MKTDRELLMEVFLDEGVPLKLKKRIAKHLGSMVSAPLSSTVPAAIIPVRSLNGSLLQSPSTQKLLEAQEAAVNAASAAGILPPAILAPQKPIVPVAARIVGGQVNNGDGTTGKRKW
jgi:anti-sigma factor RsiW